MTSIAAFVNLFGEVHAVYLLLLFIFSSVLLFLFPCVTAATLTKYKNNVMSNIQLEPLPTILDEKAD